MRLQLSHHIMHNDKELPCFEVNTFAIKLQSSFRQGVGGREQTITRTVLWTCGRSVHNCSGSLTRRLTTTTEAIRFLRTLNSAPWRRKALCRRLQNGGKTVLLSAIQAGA